MRCVFIVSVTTAFALDFQGLLTNALERLRQEFDETADWRSLLGLSPDTASAVSEVFAIPDKPTDVPETLEVVVRPDKPTEVPETLEATITAENAADPPEATITAENAADPPEATITAENAADPPEATITAENAADPPEATITAENAADPPEATITADPNEQTQRANDGEVNGRRTTGKDSAALLAAMTEAAAQIAKRITRSSSSTALPSIDRTLLIVYQLPEQLESSNDVLVLLQDSLNDNASGLGFVADSDTAKGILYDLDAAIQQEKADAAATALAIPGIKQQIQQLQRSSVLRTVLNAFHSTANDEGNENGSTPLPLNSHYLEALHIDLMHTDDAATAAEVLALVASHAHVRSVSYDEVLSFDDEWTSGKILTESNLRMLNSDSEAFPNDTHYSRQWALHEAAGIRAPEAWSIWSGYGQERNVTVALLDSGVLLDHKDMIGNLWNNKEEICGNGMDDDRNGYVDDCNGWDFVEARNHGNDPHGHGSASCGIIAAQGHNGRGIAPICWNCNIMNLRVLDANKQGRVSAFVEALDYAVRKGAKISNNSYGGAGGSFESLRNAIERAPDMLFVAAAGNDGNDNDNPSYRVVPASWALANMISVAAIDDKMQLADFSNYGATTVHLAAPGKSVLAPTLDNAYQFQSGTSFASPQVAGVAGLIWGRYPSLTVADVKRAIVESARPVAGLRGKVLSGGVLDAAMALEAAAVLDQDNGVCPPGSALVTSPDGSVFVECRCPSRSQWNGNSRRCEEVEELELHGPCENNGPCSYNSRCKSSTSLFGRVAVFCQCYPGYAYAEDSNTVCVPETAIPLTASEYTSILQSS